MVSWLFFFRKRMHGSSRPCCGVPKPLLGHRSPTRNCAPWPPGATGGRSWDNWTWNHGIWYMSYIRLYLYVMILLYIYIYLHIYIYICYICICYICMYIYMCNLKIFQDFCLKSILASSPYSRDSWFRPLSEMMFLDRMFESLRVWVFGCMAYAYGRHIMKYQQKDSYSLPVNRCVTVSPTITHKMGLPSLQNAQLTNIAAKWPFLELCRWTYGYVGK